MKKSILVQVDSKKTGFELYSKLKKDIEDRQLDIKSENKKKLELQTKHCIIRIRPNDPYMSYSGYRYDVIYGFNSTDIKYSEKISDYIVNFESSRSTLKGKIFNDTTLKIFIGVLLLVAYIIPYIIMGIQDGQAKELPDVKPTGINTIQLSTPIINDEVESIFVEESETDKYFDVPLDYKLQDYIFKLCDKHKIDPSIVIAIIGRESNYDASAIGDNGDSFGLMQIQPAWHQERMDKLDCHDLLDSYQNVAVGIDYLADLYSTGKQTEWVLMAYNGGCSYANDNMTDGTITEYAETVLSISEELKTNKGE